ncbi:hypothetical protein QNI19_08335 [Cytophagaceae bacterium DM2B3-1]|uniref:Tetratricopeptide repeat protein n=1 Tax=Xanthocytophaga flava TaxID=3048013 RepID=A0ABT7CHD5_9BACT|nr:hypothetical protein [Xanthocytophaga flavus]MDJ1471079.1 hypothetical protein [Xanthocytophaga flavus]MDJ1492936.1 hypothetical protein [Xanthocytophaga flavus]
MEITPVTEQLHLQIQQAEAAQQYLSLTSYITELQKQPVLSPEDMVNLNALQQQLAFSPPEQRYIWLYLGKYFTGKDNIYAETLLKKSAAATIQTFGEKSFDTGIRIIDLAEFYAKVQMLPEAIRAYRGGISILQDTNAYGVSDYSIPAHSMQLAQLYLQTGELTNYETTLKSVIHWFEQLLVKEPGTATVIKERMAEAQLKLADYHLEYTQATEPALTLYQQLKAGYLEREGDTILQPMCDNRMGIVCEKAQQWEQAVAHYQKARKALVRLFGESHGDIAWVDERIAHCQQNQ